MVVITGQVNSDQLGRDVFQEADITGSAEPFVKHSYLLHQNVPYFRIVQFIIKRANRRAGIAENGGYSLRL